ncbi:MAG TPA: gephyrin-like molybdotransferase Glp [Gaiellaceae bacterium]|jgi:molybdopterin molybdotransferase|nr:gephyrin-like molybdotransferase Glp [Gaiellaceae bacterium]
MPSLVSLEEAQRLVLDRVRPLEAERVPVERAAGRVLAEAPVSATDLPPFPSSAMDGFAVRAAEAQAGAVLPVVGRIVAGAPAGRALASGEAMAVSTGGVVPEGADAVVPLELVDEADGTITVREAVAAGANVRPRGGDARAGEPVLAPGNRLGPVGIGALAAAGVHEVQCRKRPRVGILVTGSELRRPGEPLEPGEIYESNGLQLAAALGEAGAVPAQLGVVPDDETALERTMERALLGFDMLVTSGGASVGPHDLVRKVQAGLRAEEVFWGVAVKPGKPVAFSMRRAHPLFNLPGNPVSVLVCFLLFVRPAVNAQLGLPDPLPAFSRGTLATSLRRNRERHEFVRARTRRDGNEVVLEPLAGQESHMIVRAGAADALVSVEAGEGELEAGGPVRFLWL